MSVQKQSFVLSFYSLSAWVYQDVYPTPSTNPAKPMTIAPQAGENSAKFLKAAIRPSKPATCQVRPTQGSVLTHQSLRFVVATNAIIEVPVGPPRHLNHSCTMGRAPVKA